jgi:hypothetical protein
MIDLRKIQIAAIKRDKSAKELLKPKHHKTLRHEEDQQQLLPDYGVL